MGGSFGTIGCSGLWAWNCQAVQVTANAEVEKPATPVTNSTVLAPQTTTNPGSIIASATGPCAGPYAFWGFKK